MAAFNNVGATVRDDRPLTERAHSLASMLEQAADRLESLKGRVGAAPPLDSQKRDGSPRPPDALPDSLTAATVSANRIADALSFIDERL